MALSNDAVLAALSDVKDPSTAKGIVELGWVRDVAVDDEAVHLTIALPDGAGPDRAELGRAAREALAKVAGPLGVDVKWTGGIAGRVAPSTDPLPKVKNIVLVMSGKGGVGKSSVATNVTLALHRAGYRVGLLDADIYGPSIPTMLGVSGRPVSLDGKLIEPLERFGVKLMSIGFMLEDPKAAVIWRGPMLSGALKQFLSDVNWGELDFLILDLPPGTGDVALSLSQHIRSTGAIIVTTPQPVATDDVFKSVSMCQKVNIPVLGVVENMSFFIDSAGVRHELFGKGGGAAVAEFAKAPLLGQVPIDPLVREWADKGTPVTQAAPGSAASRVFVEIAEQLVDAVTRHNESNDDAGPVIDRSGGQGGKRRLPMSK